MYCSSRARNNISSLQILPPGYLSAKVPWPIHAATAGRINMASFRMSECQDVIEMSPNSRVVWRFLRHLETLWNIQRTLCTTYWCGRLGAHLYSYHGRSAICFMAQWSGRQKSCVPTVIHLKILDVFSISIGKFNPKPHGCLLALRFRLFAMRYIGGSTCGSSLPWNLVCQSSEIPCTTFRVDLCVQHYSHEHRHLDEQCVPTWAEAQYWSNGPHQWSLVGASVHSGSRSTTKFKPQIRDPKIGSTKPTTEKLRFKHKSVGIEVVLSSHNKHAGVPVSPFKTLTGSEISPKTTPAAAAWLIVFILFLQSRGLGVRDVDNSHNIESSRRLGDKCRQQLGDLPKSLFWSNSHLPQTTAGDRDKNPEKKITPP